MRFNRFRFALAASTLVSVAAGMAHGETVYYLVGTRHVYRVGDFRDANVQAREDIEKAYADKVAQDQETFQKNIDAGNDRDKESAALNADLDALANDRDQQLGALFENADDLRVSHPELRVDADGPYQVMGIRQHREEDTIVFDSYTVYAPWPGYVVVDGLYYGGWTFGVVYSPFVFINTYRGWHDHYYHGERFYRGFRGYGRGWDHMRGYNPHASGHFGNYEGHYHGSAQFHALAVRHPGWSGPVGGRTPVRGRSEGSNGPGPHYRGYVKSTSPPTRPVTHGGGLSSRGAASTPTRKGYSHGGGTTRTSTSSTPSTHTPTGGGSGTGYSHGGSYSGTRATTTSSPAGPRSYSPGTHNTYGSSHSPTSSQNQMGGTRSSATSGASSTHSASSRTAPSHSSSSGSSKKKGG